MQHIDHLKNHTPTMKQFRILPIALLLLVVMSGVIGATPLRLHAIFTDHMVLQRDKPITVWGWANGGNTVRVQFDAEQAEATAARDTGRWEVTFPAREASADPVSLTAITGNERIALNDILIGDVWVLYGQSNMAWPLSKTTGNDIARAQADIPNLRHFKIQSNEQATPQIDIRPEAVQNDGWEISTPETAGGFSGVGYHFGVILQRSLDVPIGLINTARGGASIESMVPARKFAEHPITLRYAQSVEKRIDEFDARAAALRVWENQLNRAKGRNRPESEWPPKPEGHENLTSWNIPGKSPSDRSSVYNGMFVVFQGLHLKGVLFHQGYNNAMNSTCRPKLYRALMKLMVEGIREDFNDSDLAFGIIGLPAGGNAQNADNFELESIDPGAYIREAQRLGLADVENQKNLYYIPSHDVRVPGLHPSKKREHGERAARWALANLYPEIRVLHREVEMLSCEPQGNEFVLTFKGSIIDSTRTSIPEGFSIAGEDGKFYMAHARYPEGRGHPSNWPNVIRVWSPLVEKPVALRYAWGRAPMGNLKMQGDPDMPFPSFRTDDWDFPESEDPTEAIFSSRGAWNPVRTEAEERLEFRRTEEAKRGLEVLAGIKRLGRPNESDD